MARPPAPAPNRRPSAPRPPSGGGRRPPARPAAPAPKRRSPLWTFVQVVIALFVIGVVLVGVVVGVAYARTSIPDPQPEALAATTTVLYKDGSVMGTFPSNVNRTVLTPDQMPAVVKKAAVASEDRSFYQNKGVSLSGLGRAVWGVVTGQPSKGGGSTITQQYVKNITGNDERSYSRKANEALVALKLDQHVPKDVILTNYLNTIYFGRNANGVAAAAKAYFGVDDPSTMTFQQAALLIGIVPAPSAWDPAKDPADAQKRYTYVINGMLALKYITPEQAAASPTMPATITQPPTTKFTGTTGYVLREVQKEAQNDISSADVQKQLGLTGGSQTDVNTAGLTITTTVDPKLQQQAVDTLNDPRAYPVRNRPATLKAGLLSIDPATGGVVAMYGGSDYQASPLNTVTQGTAQAGSTFKPFTLMAALEQGIPLSATYNGKSPQYFAGYTNNGKPAPVSNFGPGNGEQFGFINLVQATQNSVNTVFVQLNRQVTPAKTVDMAKRFGISDTIPDVPSNVLGTATVHPIQMAGAYAAMAAQGVYHKPHFVASMKRASTGATYTTPVAGTRVVDSKVMGDATYAMQQVVKSGTAASVGRALRGRPAAGKTGTVQDNHAAWFDAFTPQLATVAVLYNPTADGKGQLSIPPYAGYEVSGGTIPATIWSSFMTKALAGQPFAAFPAPSRQVSTATTTPTPTSSPSSSPSESSPSPSATSAPTPSSTDGTTDQSTSPSQDGQGPNGNGQGADGSGGGTDGQGGQNNAAGQDLGQTIRAQVAERIASGGLGGGQGTG